MINANKQIGAIRILTNKFNEIRKEFNENRSLDKIEVGSSLSDTGKTRYI
jgi:hypothetical protein